MVVVELILLPLTTSIIDAAADFGRIPSYYGESGHVLQ